MGFSRAPGRRAAWSILAFLAMRGAASAEPTIAAPVVVVPAAPGQGTSADVTVIASAYGAGKIATLWLDPFERDLRLTLATTAGQSVAELLVETQLDKTAIDSNNAHPDRLATLGFDGTSFRLVWPRSGSPVAVLRHGVVSTAGVFQSQQELATPDATASNGPANHGLAMACTSSGTCLLRRGVGTLNDVTPQDRLLDTEGQGPVYTSTDAVQQYAVLRTATGFLTAGRLFDGTGKPALVLRRHGHDGAPQGDKVTIMLPANTTGQNFESYALADSGGSLLLAYTDNDNHLFASPLDSNLTPLAFVDSKRCSTLQSYQVQIRATAAKDRFLISCSDSTSGAQATLFKPDGTTVNPPGNLVGPDLLFDSILEEQGQASTVSYSPAITTDGTSYFVSLPTRSEVKFSQAGLSGSTRRKNLTLLEVDTAAKPGTAFGLLQEPAPRYFLSAAAGQGGAFLAAWTDARDGFASLGVFGTVVPATGEAAVSKRLSGDVGHHFASAVAWSGSRYLVASQAAVSLAPVAPSSNRINIEVRAVDASGAPIGEPRFVTDAGFSEYHGSPAVASNGNDFLVAWADRTGLTTHVAAARVSASGQPLDATAIVLDAASKSVNANVLPAIAWTGTHYLVAYLADAPQGSAESYLVRTTLVGADGAVGATTDVATATYAQQIRVACRKPGCLVSWENASVLLDEATSAPVASSKGKGDVVWDGQAYVLVKGQSFLDAWVTDAGTGALLADGLDAGTTASFTGHALAAIGAGKSLLVTSPEGLTLRAATISNDLTSQPGLPSGQGGAGGAAGSSGGSGQSGTSGQTGQGGSAGASTGSAGGGQAGVGGKGTGGAAGSGAGTGGSDPGNASGRSGSGGGGVAEDSSDSGGCSAAPRGSSPSSLGALAGLALLVAGTRRRRAS